MNSISIRPEAEADRAEVHAVVEAAFREQVYSDQTEHLLVDRLRHSDSYIPELSLVASLEGRIVGHILLTRISIGTNIGRDRALALAPVSVLPEMQGKGIGSQLIREAHDRARQLGYEIIVLVGHPDFYPRFGYQKASRYGISVPFDAPDEAVMVVELVPGSLSAYHGQVTYDPAFGME